MNEVQLEFFFKLISIYLERKGDEKKTIKWNTKIRIRWIFRWHRLTLEIISHTRIHTSDMKLFIWLKINVRQLGDSTSRIELRLAAKMPTIAIGKLKVRNGHSTACCASSQQNLWNSCFVDSLFSQFVEMFNCRLRQGAVLESGPLETKFQMTNYIVILYCFWSLHKLTLPFVLCCCVSPLVFFEFLSIAKPINVTHYNANET